MKKIPVLLLLVLSAFALFGEDLQLKNGTLLKDFSGLGSVAPVTDSKTGPWGIVVYYEKGEKTAVVQVKDFPKDFPFMAQVNRRAELIQGAKAKAIAADKEQQLEVKEELERKKRLKKIVEDAKKAEKEEAAEGKKAKKSTKSKSWKK